MESRLSMSKSKWPQVKICVAINMAFIMMTRILTT